MIDPSFSIHPPFDGVLDGGFVWGRGAIDMKGPIAMMLSAILGLVREGQHPAGRFFEPLLHDTVNATILSGGHFSSRSASLHLQGPEPLHGGHPLAGGR